MSADAASRAQQVKAAVDVMQRWIDRRQRAMVGQLHACGQSPAQLHVLGLLNEIGPTTVSHLATRLSISPPSASAIVDRMADAELVLRERSEEDRRVVTVTLAPPGREALQRAIGGRREMLERVLEQLDDAELADTIRVINRLEVAIGRAMSTAPAARPEAAAKG
jgi:DNA-binding MarR family transcriptional regulator